MTRHFSHIFLVEGRTFIINSKISVSRPRVRETDPGPGFDPRDVRECFPGHKQTPSLQIGGELRVLGISEPVGRVG